MTGLRISSTVLSRAEAQPVVFADQPSRSDLYELPEFDIGATVRLRVHRNVAVERLITPALGFARFAGIDLQADFQAYDDTLSFAALTGSDPDVELVWIDVARLGGLSGTELGELLTARIGALRAMTSAPIMVFDIPGTDPRAGVANDALRAFAEHAAAVLVCPMSEVACEMGDRFLSARAADLTAVPISPAALMRLAQRLGLSWLPAAIGRIVRGIAIDLDNTLYAGVLGEDGAAGLVVSDAHLQLQQALKALHERGVFLAVLSKNEPADVQALFAERTDFALAAADIDAWGVGWGQKSRGLEQAAESVRVAPDAFLLLDDNPGELVEVNAWNSGVFTIHAADPALALRALQLAPGLFRFSDAGADTLRVGDLAAEEQRRELRERVADPRDYLAALSVVLRYCVDRADQVKRLAELSAKTNQFVTALARIDEVQLAERIADEHSRVISVALSDRLADAGIVAMISARRDIDGTVVVEDVCMSCRALGRGLEKVLLGNALARIAADLGVADLRLDVTEGPRNAPAMSWLAQLGGTRDGTQLVIAAPAERTDLPVTIEWEA